MVKLPTGSTPAPEADPIPMLTVEEIACPLPAELGTAVTIRVAQFPDGKWRYGYYLSAEWIAKKIDKHPMPDGVAFDERESAVEACMAHCVDQWRRLPAAVRIDKTIEWLTAANEPAPVAAPEAVVEPTPVVEPTVEAAIVVTGVDIGTGDSQSVMTVFDQTTGEILSTSTVSESLLADIPWAHGAEFDSLACVKIALRSSVASRFNAELHMGQAGDKFYATTWLEYLKEPTAEWFKTLDLPTDNLRHACVHLTRDSINGEDPRDVELRAAEALLSLVKPMDVRLAADVGAHVEALRNGVETKAVRTLYGLRSSTPVESPVVAEAAAEATPAAAEPVVTETTAAETPVVEPTVVEPTVEPAKPEPVAAAATTSTEEKPDPIAEHARELAATRLEVGELSVEIEELTEQRKVAKKRLKEATAELRNLQRWKPQPVRAAETKADPKPAAATDPTKADEPKPASDTTAATPTANWRDIPFSDLATHGLKPGIIEICSENPKKPILTMGDWADWNKKYQPTEIARIGQAKADQIADAMEKFWKAHPEFTV